MKLISHFYINQTGAVKIIITEMSKFLKIKIHTFPACLPATKMQTVPGTNDGRILCL